MANQEHLKILKQGVEIWNRWREENITVQVNLIGANLEKHDLREANFVEADLREANFTEADLSRRTNLRGANLRGANFHLTDLYGAELTQADLSKADLYRTYLRKANLSSANLTDANLKRCQSLETNFEEVNLTGACIEDWNINSQTNLNNVICDYIYLKENQQERRPQNPNKNFAPGDFARLFQKVRETVDLIFRDGIDWPSFAISFQELQKEQKVKIAGENEQFKIRAIKTREDGSFVIRIEIPPQLEKAEIEQFFQQKYEKILKFREQYYREKLQAKDNEIEIYKNHNTSLERIIVTLANKPITINNNPMASSGDTYKGNFGIGHMSGGEIQDGAKVAGILNEAEQKNLAEAAAEIQQLLEQLEASYPSNTTSEQMVVAAKAIEQIESNPTLKQRAINAVKEGGIAAFESAIDHPIASFIINAIKGWREFGGE